MDVFASDRVCQRGVVCGEVALKDIYELVVIVASRGEATFAPDKLSHRNLPA